LVPPGALLRVLPGLVVTGAAAAACYGLAQVVPVLNPSTIAVVLGVIVANVGLHRPALVPGTQLAGRRLLRIAVVLLGLQLSARELVRLGLPGLSVVLVTVAVTFAGTQLIAAKLGLSRSRGLLIATGFSICGASAVAAMEPVADGDQDDTAVAVGLVTLCGSLAIVVLPLLRVPLGLDPAAFGSWVGASVHDVGQTVATAQRVPGALTTAVVVKLTRVVLLAPLVTATALVRRHRQPAGGPPRRPAPMPLFVAGFLAAVVLTSLDVLPAGWVAGAKTVQGILLVMALFGLGTGIRVPSLIRTGGRSLLVGLASWLLVAVVAYLGVRLAG
jgi:uncharacterized integral membrane protein (TIGR00698 family)